MFAPLTVSAAERSTHPSKLTPLSSPLPAEVSTPAAIQSLLVNGFTCARESCVAFGDWFAVPAGAIIQRVNNRWRAVRVTSHSVSLDAASCESATFCVFVGLKTHGRHHRSQRPYVLVENSGQWSTLALPLTSIRRALTINSVACWSVGHCVMVGFQKALRARGVDSAALTLNGNHLSVDVISRSSKARDVSLNSVACMPGGDCAAVGYTDSSSGGNFRIVADTFHRGRWTEKVLERAAKSQLDEPKSISCTATYCVAGGQWNDQYGDAKPLLVKVMNSIWSVHYLESNRNRQSFVESVSCSPVLCSALQSSPATCNLLANAGVSTINRSLSGFGHASWCSRGGFSELACIRAGCISVSGGFAQEFAIVTNFGGRWRNDSALNPIGIN